jgi:hypothetical protein
LLEAPKPEVGGEVCCVGCRQVIGTPAVKRKPITQIAPPLQSLDSSPPEVAQDSSPPTDSFAPTTSSAVPLAKPVDPQTSIATPILAAAIFTSPTSSRTGYSYAPANPAVGASYLARMHAQTAVHLLRLGGAFLLAGFLVEVGVVLILAELKFNARVVRFAVPAGLIQFLPSVIIFMAADALFKRRRRGLVTFGAILSLLFGAALVMGSIGLVFYGFRYCPMFFPALLAAGISLIFIYGGFRALSAISDPEFQAAFDRDRRPLP